MRSAVKVTTVGAAAAAALAACGGGSSTGSPPSGSPTQVVAAAAAATQSAGTARLDMSEVVTFSGVPGQTDNTLHISATGAVDAGRKLASVDLNLSGVNSVHDLKVFADGTTAYVSTAGLGLTGVKPWIKVDASNGSAGVASISSSAFSGAKLLSKLSGVKVVGNQTLHGAATTHYQGTLDLGTALNQLGGSSSGFSQLGQLGPALQNALAGTTLPLDVWIDGQDRVRRLTMNMDLAPFMRTLLQQFEPSGGTSLPSSMKAEISLDFSLFDFGGNFDLTPPSADQVGPAPPNFKLPGAGTSL